MKITSWNFAITLLATVFILSSSLSTAYAGVEQTSLLKLEKIVITDDGGNAQADDWFLSASGVDASFDFGNSGGSGVFESVLIGNEYTLSESSGPDGYSTTGIWNCTGGTFTSPNKIILNPTAGATCTITNDDIAPTLKLVKELVLDDGGTANPDNWTLMAMAEDPDPMDRNISTMGDQGSFETVYANVRMQLGETDGPDGYSSVNNGLWTCVLTLPNGDVSTIPFSIGAITLNEGDSAVCTITNDDIAPTLKLVKELVLDDGGTAIPDNWTLTAMAEDPDPMDRNVTTLGGQGVFEEVYANVRMQLAESNGPEGYTALDNGLWTCVLTMPNGDVSPIPFSIGAITLNEGDSAICTIINDDLPQIEEPLTREQQRAVDHANAAQARMDSSKNLHQDQSKTCEQIQREISKLVNKGQTIPAELKQTYDDNCS